jgi:AcrR family transcriptional regulator
MPKAKDENKISQIHQAALQLVIKTGFGGLKMADVAKEAGMATGTLYIYYPGKEELINGLFLDTKKEIVAALLAPEHMAENMYKSFKNMWLSYFSFCFQNPEKMMFAEQFLFSGYISEANIQETERMLTPLNSFLEEAISQGLIREIHIEILKAHMSGSIHEIVKYLHKNRQSVSLSDKELFFELTWNSIRK